MMLKSVNNHDLPENKAVTPSVLSEREMQILEGIVDGLNYHQVADKLFISPHTVRKHIANIYEKLHVSNKTAAIKIALKKNWFKRS